MQNLSLQDIFLNNLKFYRKKAGLSQEALSEKLNKGVNYINRIESHASFPTIQVIEEIAAILTIKASQLFEEENTPKNIVFSNREQFITDIIESLHRKITADIKAVIDEKLS